MIPVDEVRWELLTLKAILTTSLYKYLIYKFSVDSLHPHPLSGEVSLIILLHEIHFCAGNRTFTPG